MLKHPRLDKPNLQAGHAKWYTGKKQIRGAVTIYSQLFKACVQGETHLVEKLELERVQLVKAGHLGLRHMISGDEETTLHGRRKRQEKDREATQNLVNQVTLLQDAIIRLDNTKQEFDTKMNDLNGRLETRLDAIDQKLNDPKANLSEDERRKLEQERQDLIILQQQMIEERQRLQERYDDIQRRLESGDPVDPRELDDLEKDLRDTMGRIEAQMPVFDAKHETQEIASASQKTMAVEGPTF